MEVRIYGSGHRVSLKDQISRWLTNGLGLLLLALYSRGVVVDNQGWFVLATVLTASAVLGLLNTVVRPYLLMITVPLNVMTLGLFTLVINAGLLMLMQWVVPGMHFENFAVALAAAVVLLGFQLLLGLLGFGSEIRVRVKRSHE